MKKSVILLAAIIIPLLSCNEKSRTSVKNTSSENGDLLNSQLNSEQVEGAGYSSKKLKSVPSLLKEELSKDAFHTNAHEQFLNEPLKFAPVPDQGVTEGRTAVVGSKLCMLYPKEAFSFNEHGEAVLNNVIHGENYGTPVPFSSIVQISGEKLYNGAEGQNPYAGQMFEFQANWNWFYPVKWNGMEGYIFGSDLKGLGDSIENNRVTAELYRTNGKFTEFYPVSGYGELEDSVKASLEENRLAIQKTPSPNWLSADDMIDDYQKIKRDSKLPVFITTDLAAHCQHLIFDRMLQYTEETFFLPRLEQLTEHFISALSERSDVPKDIQEKAVKYFQVPLLILKTAPKKIVDKNNWREPVTYEEPDEESLKAVFAGFAEDVIADCENIYKANGRTESAVMGVEEDFSQYKPRGHYTKNPLLETYFRAEMWFGRIHFLIAEKNPSETDRTKTALLICDTVQKNPDLYNEWKRLFDPITTMIGISDDLSFYEILPLWNSEKTDAFENWSNDSEKVVNFMNLCHEKLRPPAINSNPVFSSDGSIAHEGEDLTKPAMGWRLFGQRFTYDSYIHDKVSPPRLMSRDIVRGLDVMKVFGSKSAEILLQNSDYAEMEGLKEKLDALQTDFSSYGSEFWNQSYYNQVLAQVKTQATFEQGAGFYFTESPLWNVKSLLSSHGTWAELRHDTILYVKQTAAERAGDGDFEPTFRTLPVPDPVHYIEPNVPFWKISFNSVVKLMQCLNDNDLLDDESAYTLENLSDIYRRCIVISEKEAQNKAITSDENDWIPTIVSYLKKLIFVHNQTDYIEDFNQLRMDCIADVFSNYELGLCLEVGVARPHKIYVPLNDSQGGKRIAIGFCFSYYEFTQPVNNRLTDDEWKDMTNTVKLEKYMPDWEKECLLDK
ncbi:DUF3160 domain-containing protein [Treponema sp.]|uniref:DUF3160 domain-containing protein n=1 Tax=Treponema sp. TaxID=166 RepID=UPI00388DD036